MSKRENKAVKKFGRAGDMPLQGKVSTSHIRRGQKGGWVGVGNEDKEVVKGIDDV